MTPHALSAVITFAACLGTLNVAHAVADHWLQRDYQALNKGEPGWRGRLACATHVVTYSLCAAVFLSVLHVITGLPMSPGRVDAALAVSAITHYWADRVSTLAALAERFGTGELYRLGSPRPGQDDNPTLATGAYALDQSFHAFWLWVAALILAAGA